MDSNIPLQRKNFQKIVQFYLFECPVRIASNDSVDKIKKGKTDFRNYHKVSVRGKTFKERGLDGAKLNTLRTAMKRVGKGILLEAVSGEISDDKEESILAPEYVIIRRNEKQVPITEGFFYCIRNALAHGNFEVKDKWYYFRNVYNNRRNGIAKLREETLLKWIELVDLSVSELKQIK